MKYHIVTYGCQMNYSDSERIAAILKLAKVIPVKNIKEADLLIINSCSVRQSAINRIYGQLINFRKIQKTGKTILTGCLLESDKKKLKDKFDLIIDIKELTNPKNNELKKLLKLLKPRASKQEFKAFDYTNYFKINPQYRSNFSAYIPIMTGCNNFCAYCAVPYTRGREISRPAEEIIKEVKKLIKKGYKEIILLGQNVNSYRSSDKNSSSEALCEGGSKKNKQINFPQLLKIINNIPGKFWIRFLTSHPKDMSSELIEIMAKSEKVCEYVHLPIQAGDDKILQKMNRRYTSAHYLKLIKKIKSAYKKQKKDLAISTDIIVGFPGETKAHFANTAKIMREVKYDMAYLAQYSPRAGTAAAKLKDNVSIIEKKRRKEFLNDILRKTALSNNKKYEGKIVEVLIENPPVGGVNNVMFGKTRTFKNVRISLSINTNNLLSSVIARSPQTTKQSLANARKNRTFIGSSVSASGRIPQNDTIIPGHFALIKITQANAWGLEGEMVGNDK